MRSDPIMDIGKTSCLHCEELCKEDRCSACQEAWNAGHKEGYNKGARDQLNRIVRKFTDLSIVDYD